MDAILIVGSSGHAKVVIDAVEREGKYRVAGLLDRFRRVGEQTLGYPILGGEEDLPRLVAEHAVRGLLVAIGDNYVRQTVVAAVAALCPEVPFVTAVHPRATVARDVTVGPGSVILAGATVNPGCRVGWWCILNTNSSLDHDSVMGDFASLAPNAATGGNVRLGAGAAVGIGATVLQRVEVGAETVIGAGAVVRGSVGPNVVAYGVPARVVRERRAGDKYL